MPPSSKRPTLTSGFPPDSPLARLANQTQTEFELGFFAGILERHPAFVEVLRLHAQNLSLMGRHADLLEIDRRWVELRPSDPVAHYNLACSLALTGDGEQALQTLRTALECGYPDLRHLSEDQDLESLHQDPRFQELIRDFEAC